MKISKERFEKLVGAYLDNETSPEDAQMLLDCIREDARMRAFFLRSCAMHKTMCGIYGKRAKFSPLAFLSVDGLLRTKKASTLKAAVEWIVVAGLFGASAALLAAAISARDARQSPDALGASMANYKTEICADADIGDAEIAIIRVAPKHSVLAP